MNSANSGSIRASAHSRASGELIALTPKHFDTLLYLLENAGEVLEKDRLLSAIWPGMIVEENNLSQAISNLRRILGDNGAQYRYILTVPRRGYRFVAEVRTEAQHTPKDLPTVSSSDSAPSWRALVATGLLLVIYMGVSRCESIQRDRTQRRERRRVGHPSCGCA